MVRNVCSIVNDGFDLRFSVSTSLDFSFPICKFIRNQVGNNQTRDEISGGTRTPAYAVPFETRLNLHDSNARSDRLSRSHRSMRIGPPRKRMVNHRQGLLARNQRIAAGCC